jgi:hypothetical protein
MKPIQLSKTDARRLLSNHHFAQTTAHEVFEHLGSIQFDPLKPVGCNHDLVLQARVPDYKVDDWQKLAYQERFIYDAWDKQASLVMMRDWPYRRIYHHWHETWWRKDILESHPEKVLSVLQELKKRGPMLGKDLEPQGHIEAWQGSWYGPKLTKNILRALWHTGKVLTHSRKHGHHVYDLAENIVPKKLFRAKPVSEKDSLEFLIKSRYQAMGLLRPGAGLHVWSLGVTPAERNAVIDDLIKREVLIKVEVEGMKFQALPSVLEKLERKTEPRMIFVAPLDQLMWDRKAVHHMFDFEYLWEVYVPEPKRRWGYYVLPVFYKDGFVARIDSKLSKGVWQILSWQWEVKPTLEMLEALEDAVTRFRSYLGAGTIKLPRIMDTKTKSVFKYSFEK